MIRGRILFQPEPAFALVATVETSSGPVSAIARSWRDGEEARCRLCPEGRCSAFRGVCQVVVNVPVGEGEGRMFSTVGMNWIGRGDGQAHDERPFFKVVGIEVDRP